MAVSIVWEPLSSQVRFHIPFENLCFIECALCGVLFLCFHALDLYLILCTPVVQNKALAWILKRAHRISNKESIAAIFSTSVHKLPKFST